MPLKQEGLDSNPWRAKETEAQVNTGSLQTFLLLSKEEGKKHKDLWNYSYNYNSSLSSHKIEA